MTHTTHETSAVGGTSIWQRLSELNAALVQRRAQHRAYNSTVKELSTLSNRDLIDMGIDRADIHDIARQAVYGA